MTYFHKLIDTNINSQTSSTMFNHKNICNFIHVGSKDLNLDLCHKLLSISLWSYYNSECYFTISINYKCKTSLVKGNILLPFEWYNNPMNQIDSIDKIKNWILKPHNSIKILLYPNLIDYNQNNNNSVCIVHIMNIIEKGKRQ